MSEDILAAVKDACTLLRIQVEDEVGGVVGVAALISDRKQTEQDYKTVIARCKHMKLIIYPFYLRLRLFPPQYKGGE